jgi:uncharacterized protein YkwD
MNKRFAFLFILFAFFSFNSHAQNQTVTAQANGFVGNKTVADELNRPRLAVSEKKVSTLEFERRILDLINQKRAEKGLEPLRWSEDAAKIARLHSQNMAIHKFFSHVGQDGLSVDERADALGVSKWRAIGENIAYNRGYQNPIESACEGWMKSSAHRENLLSARWKETGVGVAVAADGTYYFTQVFLVR